MSKVKSLQPTQTSGGSGYLSAPSQPRRPGQGAPSSGRYANYSGRSTRNTTPVLFEGSERGSSPGYASKPPAPGYMNNGVRPQTYTAPMNNRPTDLGPNYYSQQGPAPYGRATSPTYSPSHAPNNNYGPHRHSPSNAYGPQHSYSPSRAPTGSYGSYVQPSATSPTHAYSPSKVPGGSYGNYVQPKVTSPTYAGQRITSPPASPNYYGPQGGAYQGSPSRGGTGRFNDNAPMSPSYRGPQSPTYAPNYHRAGSSGYAHRPSELGPYNYREGPPPEIDTARPPSPRDIARAFEEAARENEKVAFSGRYRNASQSPKYPMSPTRHGSGYGPPGYGQCSGQGNHSSPSRAPQPPEIINPLEEFTNMANNMTTDGQSNFDYQARLRKTENRGEPNQMSFDFRGQGGYRSGSLPPVITTEPPREEVRVELSTGFVIEGVCEDL